MKPEPNKTQAEPSANPTARSVPEDQILRAIREVKFGSVEITVHEGRVVQVEKREKIRFSDPR